MIIKMSRKSSPFSFLNQIDYFVAISEYRFDVLGQEDFDSAALRVDLLSWVNKNIFHTDAEKAMYEEKFKAYQVFNIKWSQSRVRIFKDTESAPYIVLLELAISTLPFFSVDRFSSFLLTNSDINGLLSRAVASLQSKALLPSDGATALSAIDCSTPFNSDRIKLAFRDSDSQEHYVLGVNLLDRTDASLAAMAQKTSLAYLCLIHPETAIPITLKYYCAQNIGQVEEKSLSDLTQLLRGLYSKMSFQKAELSKFPTDIKRCPSC
jgi:hypothetical protein